MATESEFSQPESRVGHSSVMVEDQLIVWGGWQRGVPVDHASTLKRKLASSVEVFHRREGRWQCFDTTGDPPLGIQDYAICTVGKTIYYFGGGCGHGDCVHNSLYSLSISEWKWKALFITSDSDGPMRKRYCGMVSFHDSLLIIGGYGPSMPKMSQPSAQYCGRGLKKGYVITSEHHMYALLTSKWNIPTITGNRPPPIHGFTLTKIAMERAVMFGGNTLDEDSSDFQVATISQSSVHWERLNPLRPERCLGRRYHAATVLCCSLLGQSQMQILVARGLVGGAGASDCWLMSIEEATWREIKNIPHSVAERCGHSINTIAVSDSCVWLMAVGGMKTYSEFGIRTNANVALLELNLSPNGLWELGTVLENERIYERYKMRLFLKFPDLCDFQVEQPRRNLLMKDKQLQLALQQLQNKYQQLQIAQQQLVAVKRDMQRKDQQLQIAQQQVETVRRDLQLAQYEVKAVREDLQSKSLQLQLTQQEVEAVRRDVQIKDKQLQFAQQQGQQLQEKARSLQRSQQQVEQFHSNLSQISTQPWVISREELTMTQEILGSGAYGEVRVAVFRGLRVEAKCLYITASEYNLHHLYHEMTIASQIRHPNLQLLIGATTQGQPSIILTELIATNLRAELKRGKIAWQQIKSIANDVLCGLNYLHMKKPDPIIHRDVSSPNVLLEPLGAGSWRAKVSDCGSANFVNQVTCTNVYSGNEAYAAPEANLPSKHSPKMDVYSFGVLLTEMILNQPPETTIAGRAKQAQMVQWDPLANVIEVCMASSPDNRPTLEEVMKKLRLLD